MLADMVKNMVKDAADEGEALWREAAAKLDRDRADIEAEVMGDGGLLDAAHEWAAFLAWVDRAPPP